MAVAFLSIVRHAVGEVFPGAEFADSVKGNGPIGIFNLERKPTRPRLFEQLCVQKGLHGAEWFRCQFATRFQGQVKGGAGQHLVHIRLPDTPLPDSHFEGKAGLERELRTALPIVQRAVDGFFAPAREAYSELDTLFGSIIDRYTEWFSGAGHKRLPEDFSLQKSDDPDPELRRCPAFEAFRGWCIEQRLAAEGDTRWDVRCKAAPLVHPDLWNFWRNARPQRAEEFSHKEYRTCSVCKKWLARGGAVPKRDPRFGPYADFACAKCLATSV
jgi:hypothetical protein